METRLTLDQIWELKTFPGRINNSIIDWTWLVWEVERERKKSFIASSPCHEIEVNLCGLFSNGVGSDCGVRPENFQDIKITSIENVVRHYFIAWRDKANKAGEICWHCHIKLFRRRGLIIQKSMGCVSRWNAPPPPPQSRMAFLFLFLDQIFFLLWVS